MVHHSYDVIVIGAGAAGLMAAAQCGKRGRRVLVIEHTDKVGEKIRISGGGRCNFTNLYASPAQYLSANPHFVKSALARYSQHDFIKLVDRYGIAYHEKTLGQLFCDGSSKQIVEMLLKECTEAGVEIRLSCKVDTVEKPDRFSVVTNLATFASESLIIATGGLSIPKMGATDFGYRIAKQFGIATVPTRPALVPLLASESMLEFCKSLSGIALPTIARMGKHAFTENMLFTHRGVSGPAILQISSYIENPEGATVHIDLLPGAKLQELFAQEKNSSLLLSSLLKRHFPNRFVEQWCLIQPEVKRLADYKMVELERIAAQLHHWPLLLQGSEGYAKAEVTAGGVDTHALSSKTMGSLAVPSLFFIGEVVDVTGWLGGYNFQWAWASGYVAGQFA